MTYPQIPRRPRKTSRSCVKTFDQVVPIAGVAADLFYDRLFEIAPSLRRMFPADMRDQKRKLMVMLATAVQGLTTSTAGAAGQGARRAPRRLRRQGPSTTRSSARR